MHFLPTAMLKLSYSLTGRGSPPQQYLMNVGSGSAWTFDRTPRPWTRGETAAVQWAKVIRGRFVLVGGGWDARFVNG